MRISSVTMYEQSAASINRQQGEFLKISQQMASGRRVVNPSDDPQAASRAVGVDQSRAVTQQYADSRISARNSLSQTESILNSVSDAVTSAKTLLIQASSDTLSDVDRESIASELHGVYETMIGQANATDGNGRYLFGGYADNAPPFVKEANADPDAAPNVKYKGDSNAREQRIDASRKMPVTSNGEDIFMSVPSGAGYVADAPSSNEGSVTFGGPQVADVNDDNYGDNFAVSFDDSSGAMEVIVNNLDDTTNNPVVKQAYTGNGEDSQTVSFGGLDITLEGEPKSGDTIAVSKAGSDQHPPDLFKTMEEAIRVLEAPNEDPQATADFRNTVNTAMRDLDNALDNALTVRASAGARLNELDVVDGVGANRMQNYDQTLSNLVDLDYVDAISEYSLRQVGMQASQQAFVNIKGSSLFDYL
ncbi:flagellar hook-associated protein FlgL [Vreelandella subglaciescola]|uniref:Flagellar hook-associated protein 3 FlgL n=1 Tax=Vreelandella subglaciescola TaxID=29571 RepID=A0A1M7HF88_9GAMM|nr:flagellar hook-associated protein FlgL [Halomonas subglaciescola]SHM27098.1 flagellar hook-associated protein 3 FlgL [Halomonas subglaciescola]